jgi:hypothetical protein
MQDREREQARVQAEREQAYREHIAQLTIMLREAHQQNQRLLDLPRPAPTLQPTPAPQPAPVRTPAPAGDARGAMRRHILALLQDHPEGLTPAEIRDLLEVDRSLADTCQGMLRYGLLRRVGQGRYVAV